MRTSYRSIKWNYSSGGVPQEEYDELLERYNKSQLLVNWITTKNFLIKSYSFFSGVVSWVEDWVWYVFIAWYSYSGGQWTVASSWLIKEELKDFIRKDQEWEIRNYSWNSADFKWFYINKNEWRAFRDLERRANKVRIRWNYKLKSTIQVREVSDHTIPEWYISFTDNEFVKSVNFAQVNPRDTYSITLK